MISLSHHEAVTGVSPNLVLFGIVQVLKTEGSREEGRAFSNFVRPGIRGLSAIWMWEASRTKRWLGLERRGALEQAGDRDGEL
jgi:hypothetical protein